MNSIFKISFISLLAAMSLFAACKKYDNNQPEINKDIKILSDWLKLNGDKFSKGIINIKESGNTLESRSIDWSQVKKFESEQNEFFEIPFLSQNTGSLKSGIERNTSAENLYKEYRLIIQKKKSNGIITGRIKISIDGNLGNDALAKKINKIEFFDDLKAKRKRNYFCFTNRILPTRFYEKKISSVDIISNSTSNFPKPQLVRNCIPISVPIIGYVCSGNQIGEDYNVSCGYENIGNRIVEECTDGDEGSDPFDYYGYYGSDPRPTNPSNNPPPILPNQSIIDSLNGYPCAQALLTSLSSNPMINVRAEIVNLIDYSFNTSSNINLTYSVDKNLEISNLLNGYTKPPVSYYDAYEQNIYLSKGVLTNSTKDFILSVMIHEAMHATINYWRSRLDQFTAYPTNPTGIDSNTFKNMFPIFWDYRRQLTDSELAQHYQMASTYTNQVVNFLKVANPSLDNNMANALAWSGLQKTSIWLAKGSDTLNILNLQHLARKDGTYTSENNYGLNNCQ